MNSIIGRTLFTALVLALLCVVFSGCVQTQNHSTKQMIAKSDKILRVGVSTNAPPLAYKQGDTLTGLEIDFAGQLGAFLDKDIHFVELKWDDQIAALENGNIDIIMSGMTITSSRSYRVAFSKPYLRSGQVFLVRLDDAKKYSDGIYSIMGSNPVIGTISGTVGDYYISKTVAKADIKNFSTSTKAVNALLEGQIDVFVHDAPIICHFAAINEANKLVPILKMGTEEYLAWAVSKDDTTLLENINRFITTKSQNGQLQATTTKWIPFLMRQ
ncbi:substrate-binding periplasmic protein [Desulfosediminicola flagellatus]|uniref:substrate-binding periplasmic protein n=1 Tax=Desulfosediminicola flagellatus TaxID=2569541 RepID=UPI0010ABD3B1|nr:transporter substrate-binding domain-containing protein [Desulfosediminicola flagellatus]